MTVRSAALALAAIAWIGAVGAGDAVAPRPMTDEDVVEMLVAGASADEIIDAIHARPGAFDLSESMIAEMNRAGVPEAVIAAMRARMPAPPVVPEADRPRRGTVRVALRFTGAHTLHVPDYADEDLKDALDLPKEVAMRQVKDLAIYVACTTPVHVPDLWRSKTPLGRDMAGTPRHRLLAFVAGDTPEGKAPKLSVPKSLDVDLDDVEPHDLVVGVAARIGDRWCTIARSKPVKVEVEPGMPALDAAIHKRSGPFAFEVTVKAGAASKP